MPKKAATKTKSKPSKTSRALSATVDLGGLTADELVALTWAGVAYLPARPHGGDDVFNRLSRASRSRAAVISKVPRESLQAYLDSIRPHVAELTKSTPSLPSAMAKIDARLVSKPGKRASPGLWQKRAQSVAQTRDALREMFEEEPADRDVDRALKLPEGSVSRWRNVHPELFPAAKA